MIPFDEVVRLHRVSRVELTLWIAEEWVRPHDAGAAGGGWLFDAADVARVALIRELRDEMAVNEEALPLVLSLLDQLYAARRVLGGVEQILRELPSPTHDEICSRLGKED